MGNCIRCGVPATADAPPYDEPGKPSCGTCFARYANESEGDEKFPAWAARNPIRPEAQPSQPQYVPAHCACCDAYRAAALTTPPGDYRYLTSELADAKGDRDRLRMQVAELTADLSEARRELARRGKR